MKQRFVLYYDEFFHEDQKLFSPHELSSKLFTEEVRAIRSQFPFWKEHVQLICFKLELYNLEVPAFLQNEARDLKRQIERSLTKNKLFKSTVASITFFEEREKLSCLISVNEIKAINFDLNKDGLIIEIFNKIPKAISPLSSLSDGSEPFWKILQSNQNKTELLLTNTDGSIIEAIGKNIFLIKDKLVSTPDLSSGAYIDVSRKFIETSVKKNGLEFTEVHQLKRKDLLEADEIFLCNGINGIEWIKGFENKRYFSRTIRLIHEEFNNLLIQ